MKVTNEKFKPIEMQLQARKMECTELKQIVEDQVQHILSVTDEKVSELKPEIQKYEPLVDDIRKELLDVAAKFGSVFEQFNEQQQQMSMLQKEMILANSNVESIKTIELVECRKRIDINDNMSHLI